MPSISIEEEEREEPGVSRAGLWSEENSKSLYQLGDAGLWWDTFEEEPNFDLLDDFMGELTLSEGKRLSLTPPDDLTCRVRMRQSASPPDSDYVIVKLIKMTSLDEVSLIIILPHCYRTRETNREKKFPPEAKNPRRLLPPLAV